MMSPPLIPHDELKILMVTVVEYSLMIMQVLPSRAMSQSGPVLGWYLPY